MCVQVSRTHCEGQHTQHTRRHDTPSHFSSHPFLAPRVAVARALLGLAFLLAPALSPLAPLRLDPGVGAADGWEQKIGSGVTLLMLVAVTVGNGCN